MEKKHGGLKKFFGEFKKFITRGNVLDTAFFQGASMAPLLFAL